MGDLFRPGRDFLTSECIGAIANDCPVLFIKSSAVSGGDMASNSKGSCADALAPDFLLLNPECWEVDFFFNL